MIGDILLRGRLLDTQKIVDVVVRKGRVVRVGKAGKSPADFGSADSIFGPTLFDIQVNGAAGLNLQGQQVTGDIVRGVGDHLRKNGVSCWIPTVVTASVEDMEHSCRVIGEVLTEKDYAKVAPGLHLEGPHINPEDGPRGAHPRAHVRPPSVKEFMRLHKAAGGRVSYTTVAPELPGAVPFIRRAVKAGVLVSLGHHIATREQIAAAAAAGATLCTHLGNGSPPLLHRHHNHLWPQLADERLHISLIADLHHLPADALKVFTRAKGAERVVLTSDSVDVAGMPPGYYEFGGAKVELRADGKICLAGTDLLAGSSLMLLQGVVNVWKTGVMPLEQAFACASHVPARLLRLKKRFRLPQVEDKADFVLFHLKPARPVETPEMDAVFVEGVLA